MTQEQRATWERRRELGRPLIFTLSAVGLGICGVAIGWLVKTVAASLFGRPGYQPSDFADDFQLGAILGVVFAWSAWREAEKAYAKDQTVGDEQASSQNERT